MEKLDHYNLDGVFDDDEEVLEIQNMSAWNSVKIIAIIIVLILLIFSTIILIIIIKTKILWDLIFQI